MFSLMTTVAVIGTATEKLIATHIQCSDPLGDVVCIADLQECMQTSQKQA